MADEPGTSRAPSPPPSSSGVEPLFEAAVRELVHQEVAAAIAVAFSGSLPTFATLSGESHILTLVVAPLDQKKGPCLCKKKETACKRASLLAIPSNRSYSRLYIFLEPGTNTRTIPVGVTTTTHLPLSLPSIPLIPVSAATAAGSRPGITVPPPHPVSLHIFSSTTIIPTASVVSKPQSSK